jgi:hypothetical protein
LFYSGENDSNNFAIKIKISTISVGKRNETAIFFTQHSLPWYDMKSIAEITQT